MGIIHFHNILLLLNALSVYTKEMFDIRADDLLDSLLDNVYQGKFQKSVPAYKMTRQLSRFPSTTHKQITSTKLPGATKHPAMNTYAGNMTMDEFSIRKRKLDLKVLMDSNVGGVPNFDGTDDIAVQSRRFNKIKDLPTRDNILREVYFDDENATFIYKEKNRTISLMAQFLYETRYQLPYAQLLRKKYINNVKYRIGYCFALLRTLKRQQMVMFNTMKTYLDRIPTVYIHMKLYERVIKINVDIRDVMKYIVDLDKIRQSEDAKRTKRKRQRSR